MPALALPRLPLFALMEDKSGASTPRGREEPAASPPAAGVLPTVVAHRCAAHHDMPPLNAEATAMVAAAPAEPGGLLSRDLAELRGECGACLAEETSASWQSFLQGVETTAALLFLYARDRRAPLALAGSPDNTHRLLSGWTEDLRRLLTAANDPEQPALDWAVLDEVQTWVNQRVLKG